MNDCCNKWKKIKWWYKCVIRCSKKIISLANEQAASLEETAAAVEEITSIVKSSVQKVHQMSSLASQLQIYSKEGEILLLKQIRAMDHIDEQVNCS